MWSSRPVDDEPSPLIRIAVTLGTEGVRCGGCARLSAIRAHAAIEVAGEPVGMETWTVCRDCGWHDLGGLQ